MAKIEETDKGTEVQASYIPLKSDDDWDKDRKFDEVPKLEKPDFVAYLKLPGIK